MRNLLKTLSLFCLLGTLSVPAFAQVGRLMGEVTGANGEPVRDAIIKIVRTDQKGEYQVKSRKKGNFMHAGLPMGTYTAILIVEGKELDQLAGIRIRPNTETPIYFDISDIQNRQQQAAQQQQASEEQIKKMSDAQRKAYEEALAKRQAQQEKNKDLNDAFNNGMTALQANDFAGAVTFLKEAAELSPEQHVIWANLGDAQARLAQTQQGDEQGATMDAAVAAYTKAMDLNPTGQAPYANNLGLALLKVGRSDEGMAMLERAATSDPANAGKYYFNVGATLTNAGDVDGAIVAFRKASESQPDYANAHFQLAMALVSKATFGADGSMTAVEGTEEAFQKYLELEPTGANAETAKAMLASLNATVETKITQ